MVTTESVYAPYACPVVPTLYADCANSSATMSCVAYPSNATATGSSATQCVYVKLMEGKAGSVALFNNTGVVIVASLPISSFTEV